MSFPVFGSDSEKRRADMPKRDWCNNKSLPLMSKKK